jgi:hypothetical protein
MVEGMPLMQRDDSHISRTDRVRFTVLMVGVLSLSFLVRLVFLNNFRWDYDEGIHVLLARLLAAGYAPYRELFVSYPPLFAWSLQWPWRLWGSVQALQLMMTSYALLGIVAVGKMAFRLGGWLAGVVAAVGLSFSSIYLAGSRAVMTEVPSVGVAALALALAAGYYWSRRRYWLLASGLAMSASLMLKILSPFMLGLVPLMLLAGQLGHRRSWSVTLKRGISDGFVWGASLVAPLLLVLLLYDAQAMYRQVIVFRFDTRTAYSEDWAENTGMLLTFGKENVPLVLAMVWGAGVLVYKRWRAGWFVLVWLILAVTFALLQVPLREKHLPLLLPPMAVLAGVGLAEGWHAAIGIWQQPRSPIAMASLAVAGLLTVGYLLQVGNEFAAFKQTTTTPLNEDDRILAERLQRFTSTNDCLVTDNPTLAFFAERLVPPNLSEVSSARLRSGYLTYDELVEATQMYNCQVVAPVAKRLKRTRPDFVEWAKERFLGLWLYNGETEVLLAQPLAAPQPSHPLEVTLAGQVVLVGFDLVQAEADTGQALYLSLYWRPLRPFGDDYTIFIHLRDGANNTLINGDHQPYDGLVPTSRWPVGQTVKETIRLDLPSDLPAGEYQVMVGMYLLDTLERLPVNDDISGESAVVIPGILVQ